MNDRSRFFLWLTGVAIVEAISFMAIFRPSLNAALTILIALIVFVATVYRPTGALSVLLVEYLIGSKGALFKIGGDTNNDGGVPIRIILFGAFLLGWLVWSLRKKTWRSWRSYLKERTVYIALAAAIIYAFVFGLWRGSSFLLADANAWGAWVLLLPVLDIVSHEKEQWKKDMVPALLAGLVWLSLKTIGVFFLFTHGWAEVGGAFYLWLRRTGVGEITHYGQGLHRVFFQSHIYALFGLVFLFLSGWFKKTSRTWSWLSILLILLLAEIFISLSRSFWIGCAVGLVAAVLFGMGWFLRSSREERTQAWKGFGRTMAWFVGGGIISLFFVWGVYVLPGSRSENRASFFELFVSRVSTEEKAALSRWQLLPILWQKIQEHPVVGSGFGATVTYESRDPRIVEKTGGQYTTYAFEWGWLDMWIKFGVLGIPILIWLLASIGWRAWKEQELSPVLRVGIPASLVALAAVHVFTPYLNHPLGIVFLIACEGMIEANRTWT